MSTISPDQPQSSQQPYHLIAEKSVLGAALLDEHHMNTLVVDERLAPEHFYKPEHKAIFQAMLELYRSDRKIDHLTVAEQLEHGHRLEGVGGSQAIEELIGWVPATGNAAEYGRIVREYAQLRGLLAAARKIQSDVQARELDPTALIEQAERAILEVADDERQRTIRKISAVLDDETVRLHQRSTEKSAVTGTPSGFTDLDNITGGFQPGNLIVLAARPSMGKSALVTNMAENAALDGYGVAMFSLEMSESELAQRFVASQSKTRGEELRRGRVDERRWPTIMEAALKLSNTALYIDDSSDTSVLDVRAKARRLHHQLKDAAKNPPPEDPDRKSPDGLGLIIIDYLQLMRPDGRIDNRVEQVSQISRGLKSLARELQVPVIALSQLSRNVEQRSGGDKVPTLSDLRDSGAIEQDADLVMFIYRDEYYNRDTPRPGEADIIIAKHRNGPTDKITLTFMNEYPKFTNYSGAKFDA